MTHGVTRRLRVAAALLGAMVLPLLATAPAAHASAYGQSGWAATHVNGWPVPGGVYGAGINGSGRYVNHVSGDFMASGNVCNWHITAEFFDVKGRWYHTKTSPISYSCSRVGAKTISIRATMRAGRMCSTLKSNGSRLTSVCHSIK